MKSRTMASLALVIGVLVSGSARASTVSVTFRLAVEDPVAHASSCAIGVPSGSNLIAVLNAAQRNPACRLRGYGLYYDAFERKHFVDCIDHLCDVYNLYWRLNVNGRPPLPGRLGDELRDWPAPWDYVEDYSARAGDVITYAYTMLPCVYSFTGDYLCW